MTSYSHTTSILEGNYVCEQQLYIPDPGTVFKITQYKILFEMIYLTFHEAQKKNKTN